MGESDLPGTNITDEAFAREVSVPNARGLVLSPSYLSTRQMAIPTVLQTLETLHIPVVSVSLSHMLLELPGGGTIRFCWDTQEHFVKALALDWCLLFTNGSSHLDALRVALAPRNGRLYWGPL